MTATAASAPRRGTRPGRSEPSSWLPITALITLGLLPVVASRLAAIASGRLTASGGDVLGGAVPILAHLIGATVFVVVGAFQFAPRLRRSHPRWHRLAGRVVLAAGLAAALSGLWINQFGQRHDDLLYLFRWAAGAAVIVSLALGLRAILSRRIPAHRAWMIRAYAISLGAGTQVFTLGFGKALGDEEPTVALLNLAGWVVNLAVAELIIARGSRTRRRPIRTPPSRITASERQLS